MYEFKERNILHEVSICCLRVGELNFLFCKGHLEYIGSKASFFAWEVCWGKVLTLVQL